MTQTRTHMIASLAVLGIGVLWGFYWLPVREIAVLGLPGAYGTFVITMSATFILAPLALRTKALQTADPLAICALALGGAAFTFYSIGFIYGRVALVVLLFYLTPVWSTLLARYVLGWSTPKSRIVAMGVGLFGLLIMLGAKGDFPVPRNLGEWMGLLSGLLWAVGSTGIRVRREVPPLPAAFVFAAGGALAAIACSLVLEPLPAATFEPDIFRVIITSALTGGLWWVLSIPLLMWATARLDPARVGLLLMSEVLVGLASAAIIAGEHISALELFGGALVVFAGLVEVWPSRPNAASIRS